MRTVTGYCAVSCTARDRFGSSLDPHDRGKNHSRIRGIIRIAGSGYGHGRDDVGMEIEVVQIGRRGAEAESSRRHNGVHGKRCCDGIK